MDEAGIADLKLPEQQPEAALGGLKPAIGGLEPTIGGLEPAIGGLEVQKRQPEAAIEGLELPEQQPEAGLKPAIGGLQLELQERQPEAAIGGLELQERQPEAAIGGLELLEQQPEEELLRTAQYVEEFSKSLSIIAIGKTGTGKSTLVSDLLNPDAADKPVVKEGMEPGTNKTEGYTIQVGDVSVKVYDTRGLSDVTQKRDGTGHHDDETVAEVGKIINNDLNGVVLVCIQMHERLDESTVETLARLHEMYGKKIWHHVVIALTKADRYLEDEWLESKKWHQTRRSILSTKFDESLCNAKESVRKCFKIHLEMKDKEYDDLGIPVLPTSKLNPKCMSKMEMVRHQEWFNMLLLECCKKESAAALVKIHAKRLKRLPVHVLQQAGYPNVGSKLLPAVQKATGASFGLPIALIMAWKIYWHFHYSKQLKCAPRFEKANK